MSKYISGVSSQSQVPNHHLQIKKSLHQHGTGISNIIRSFLYQQLVQNPKIGTENTRKCPINSGFYHSTVRIVGNTVR